MRLTRTKQSVGIRPSGFIRLVRKPTGRAPLTIEDEGRQSDSLKKALERRLSPETPRGQYRWQRRRSPIQPHPEENLNNRPMAPSTCLTPYDYRPEPNRDRDQSTLNRWKRALWAWFQARLKAHQSGKSPAFRLPKEWAYKSVIRKATWIWYSNKTVIKINWWI